MHLFVVLVVVAASRKLCRLVYVLIIFEGFDGKLMRQTRGMISKSDFVAADGVAFLLACFQLGFCLKRSILSGE